MWYLSCLSPVYSFFILTQSTTFFSPVAINRPQHSSGYASRACASISSNTLLGIFSVSSPHLTEGNPTLGTGIRYGVLMTIDGPKCLGRPRDAPDRLGR